MPLECNVDCCTYNKYMLHLQPKIRVFSFLMKHAKRNRFKNVETWTPRIKEQV